MLGTGSTVVTAARSETDATARTWRCARPSSLIWVVTTLRSVSIAAGRHCLLGTASPALNPDLRGRFLHRRPSSVGDRRPPPARPGVGSGPTLPRPSIAIARLDELLGGRGPCRLPGPVDGGHDAGGRPVVCAESLERLAPRRCAVRARPVVRRRQPAVAGEPLAHRVEHPLGGLMARDRPRMTGAAARVGIALTVARPSVGAAAAAHPHVAGFDCPRLSLVGS